MSDPNPATVEAMKDALTGYWLDPASAVAYPVTNGAATAAARIADRLVAAAVEEVRERYAPLVEAARAMVKSSFLLDAEEQALAAALADLGEGQ